MPFDHTKLDKVSFYRLCEEKKVVYSVINIAGRRAKETRIGNAKEKGEDRKMASREEEERTGSNEKRR